MPARPDLSFAAVTAPLVAGVFQAAAQPVDHRQHDIACARQRRGLQGIQLRIWQRRCARSRAQRALDRTHQIDDAAAVIVRKFHGRMP
jgi:hypothetical protein